MDLVNIEQAEYWDAMASTWRELDDRLERTAGPPGRMAMDRLDPRPGERVLDLGCGTGPTTVELAGRVGPNGRVVGVDIADGMLEAARRRAAAGGVANASFVQADVEVHDLGAGAYDAAFSRFGVMFYADPVAAFANVRRALVPGGRLGFACWQHVAANEWMMVPGMAVLSVTDTPPVVPEPGRPGPFSLCDADRVRSILGAAGFGSVDVTAHNDEVTADEGDIADFATTALRVGAAREALEGADDATRQKAHDAVVDALSARVEGGVLRLARGVLVVSARA